METVKVRVRALLPDSLSQRIVDGCREQCAGLGLDESGLAVPLGASLREVYEIDDYAFGLRALRHFFTGHGGFASMTKGLTVINGMLWLELSREPSLTRVHRNIDSLLHSRFDVPEQDYDRDFRPHVTLFRDEDEAVLSRLAEALSGRFEHELFGVERILVESTGHGDVIIELP